MCLDQLLQAPSALTSLQWRIGTVSQKNPFLSWAALCWVFYHRNRKLEQFSGGQWVSTLCTHLQNTSSCSSFTLLLLNEEAEMIPMILPHPQPASEPYTEQTLITTMKLSLRIWPRISVSYNVLKNMLTSVKFWEFFLVYVHTMPWGLGANLILRNILEKCVHEAQDSWGLFLCCLPLWIIGVIIGVIKVAVLRS